MSERTLDYFLSPSRMKKRDAAEVKWSHAVNSRSRLQEAVTGHTHMIEADIIMKGHDPKEPIMAHPPDTDSDITLQEWLEGVKAHNVGIKLDFKSLEAVSPSVALLEEVLADPSRPVWINADIVSGPGGRARPLEHQAFLSAVTTLPTHTVLSLGWTTGWTAGTDNPVCSDWPAGPVCCDWATDFKMCRKCHTPSQEKWRFSDCRWGYQKRVQLCLHSGRDI
ncbi:putative protein FAM151B isoform 2 [Scophthalmus maximus]|uniref:Menorin-like domain-containing protein n=1 Tax=Scophthalmus maximus TaxID=52904 RepID=A0A2U9BS53_SCOMX|nr:putative protein FAM151B isoform 2 [Scophthalmus maximus]